MLKHNAPSIDPHLVTRAVMIALLITAATPAFAAGNGDWVKDFLGLFDNVAMGLTKLVTVIIGIGLLAWGIWTSLSGNFDMKRLFSMLIGGGIGFFGPGAVETLFGGK